MQNFNTNANANANTRGSIIAFPEPCLGELKMIIHYWNKYANYLDPLCVDVHKNVTFSNRETLTFWCENRL